TGRAPALDEHAPRPLGRRGPPGTSTRDPEICHQGDGCPRCRRFIRPPARSTAGTHAELRTIRKIRHARPIAADDVHEPTYEIPHVAREQHHVLAPIHQQVHTAT